MKYPQLVSTRAVNAISDWLVSRLEQLGVEAPQIYSRLLLSLLQSSVQINDPIEFSNIDTYIANRKGNNKRYLPSDTDTLKKLNAVQCLRDIVSSEQEIATIENLVDELCEKLKDFEKSIESEDDRLLLACMSVTTIGTHTTHLNLHHNHSSSFKHHNREIQEHRESIAANNVGIVDIETDPKKRYFRAFPALTKEMEDSFRIWRQNAKSLTWPVDRASLSISTSCSSSTILNSFGTAGGGVKVSDKLMEIKGEEKKDMEPNDLLKGNSLVSNENIGNNSSFKRKSKRRRGSGLPKGKTVPNMRKNSVGSGGFRQHRNSSPSYWDTDFEGCWEMGPDLIKEFIVNQNKNIRNRSTSESAAYSMKSEVTFDNNNTICTSQLTNKATEVNEPHAENIYANSPLPPAVDISFCYDDEQSDTLDSVSELTMDTYLSATAPRRLYQREASFNDFREDIKTDKPSLTTETETDDQDQFAQYKAKFNNSIQGLWEDAEPPAVVISENSMDTFPFTPWNMQMPSLPTVAPFKEDLKNFWNNYYSQNPNISRVRQQLQQATIEDAARNADENACLSFSGTGTGLTVPDLINTSDYFSMPNHLEDIERSQAGDLRRNVGDGSNVDRSTPVGVFVEKSIWSDNSGVGASDTDESFFHKVWNSHIKLNQLNGNKAATNSESKPYENSFEFSPHNTLKWSEGINAGPAQHSRLQTSGTALNANKNSCNNDGLNSMREMNVDCTDSGGVGTSISSISSSSSFSHSSYAYNWQTPVMGQNLHPDLQSWSSSNPLSLKDMYDSVGFDSNKRNSSQNFSSVTHANELAGPSVTLNNHSPSSSAFVEYSRIKSVVKLVKHENIMSQNYMPQPSRSKDRYAEDENLLTSERTHFHPIKNFADGHTFDICSALDIIDYKRSSSGYLYLEAERYLEYIRNDNYVADEEASSNVGYLISPLYGSNTCDVNSMGDVIKNKVAQEFVIKFRTRNNDMACQTDYEAERAFLANRNRSGQRDYTNQHPLCLIFSGSAKGANLQRSGLVRNDAIEVLNKAVTVATQIPVSSCFQLSSPWLSKAGGNNIESIPSQTNQSLWTITQTQNENCYDEVDFCTEDELSCCGNTIEQQWSMHEVGKMCSLRGHDKPVAQSMNNNKDGRDGAHTLWAMCSECNNEFVSIPANRLMQDELKLEADEIMSDLKYMQDLYIGHGGEDKELVTSGSEWDAEEDDFGSRATISTQNEVEEYTCNLFKNINATIADDAQPETQEVLQKMNCLIANLLQTDGEAPSADLAEVNPNSLENKCVKNIWNEGIATNIWQQTPTESASLSAKELFKHFKLEHETSAIQLEDDQYLAQLSWNPSIAEIWQRSTPIQQQPIQAAPQVEKESETGLIEKQNSNQCGKNKFFHKEETNLESGSTSAISNSAAQRNEPNSSLPKRSYQFLNNSTSAYASNKLKLGNRKRRHSASQNFFHFSSAHAFTNNNNSNNNNNNNDVADLNSFNLPLASKEPRNLCKAVLSSSTKLTFEDFVKTALLNNENIMPDCRKQNNGTKTDNALDAAASNVDLGKPKQTIITCKYWTTLDPMQEPDNVIETTTFSCLIDKNASILKHMTMATRPLTR